MKKTLLGLLVVVVLVGGGYAGYQWYASRTPEKPTPSAERPTEPKGLADFTLTASDEKAGGIATDATFTLSSSIKLSSDSVHSLVTFNPPIEYTVTERDLGMGLPQAYAQTGSGTEPEPDLVASYTLTPAQPLEENIVYSASIARGEHADHEYKWAFQVTAPFQILGTLPRHQSSYVPNNTGIEITFNRSRIHLDSPDSSITVSPSFQYSSEQHGGILTIIPTKPLAESTIYTITIKKGLKDLSDTDVLSEDRVISFETAPNDNTKPLPDISISNDLLTVKPQAQTVVPVYTNGLDGTQLAASVYRIATIDDFVKSYHDSRSWDMLWASTFRTGGANGFHTPSDASKVFDFVPTIGDKNGQQFIVVPQILAEGLYVVDIKLDDTHHPVWLQVTPLSFYYSLSGSNGFVWVYNSTSSQPVSGVTVSFQADAKARSLGETKATGLAEFETPKEIAKNTESYGANPQFMTLSGSGVTPAALIVDGGWMYWNQFGKTDNFWDHVATDRFTYRLTDTVRFWGVIKGRNENLRNQKVTVGLYPGYFFDFSRDTETDPIVTTQATISSFDTIEGSFSYEGVEPGYYNIVVSQGDTVISMTDVEVFGFTNPAYQITVTPSKHAVSADQPVDFDVDGSFFDGTPASGVKLSYSVYWQEETTGELTLDSSGKAHFSYTPKYAEGDPKNPVWYPGYLSATVNPTLAEEGDIYGEAQVMVFGPSVAISVTNEPAPEGSYAFKVHANDIIIPTDQQQDYLGKPHAGQKVTATINRHTWVKTSTGTQYDPISKTTYETFDYSEKDEVFETTEGVTEADGTWTLKRSLKREDDVWYTVDFSARDAAGRLAFDTAYAWPYWDFAYDNSQISSSLLFAGTDNSYKELSLGDDVHLALTIAAPQELHPSRVLFYRSQGSIGPLVLESKTTHDEVFDQAFIPSVEYHAVFYGPDGFVESNPATASFNEKDRALTVTLTPDKKSYRPGDIVNMDITVADHTKKPVAAEVNIAAVDEALFHVLPYHPERDILPALYQNIYTPLITGSTRYAVPMTGGGAEKGGCFVAGTQVTMADGSTKSIETLGAGDLITSFDEETSKPVTAVVQGLYSHTVRELLTINGTLQTTPEHPFYVNGVWKEAGLLEKGDRLTAPDGSRVTVKSVVRQSTSEVTVYNLIVGTYHTYFVDGMLVHNAEKGGAPRSNFVDVALFQSAHTGSDGRTSLSFKAPDNITSWHVTGIAYAPATMEAGQTFTLVQSTLPLFVDMTMNTEYLAGDAPTIRVRAFGSQFDASKSTTFGISSPSLSVDLKAQSTDGSAHFPLPALKAGDHAITVSALQGTLQDAVKKPLHVVKGSFVTAASKSYDVSSSLDHVAGNPDGFTRIQFSDQGVGRFIGTLQSIRYYDLNRADTRAASYVASELLAEHFEEDAPAEPLDLAPFLLPEGGVSLFPYSDADLLVSAVTADLAETSVYQGRMVTYFDSALSDTAADIHRVSVALYGLASLGEPVLTTVKTLLGEEPDMPATDQVYMALALAKLGDTESARDIYEDHIQSMLTSAGPQSWIAKEDAGMYDPVKLTGMVGELAALTHESDDADHIWEYLTTHSPERDLVVAEQTLMARAALPDAVHEDVSLDFKTKTLSEHVELKDGSTREFTLSAQDLSDFSISHVEGKAMLTSFYENRRDPEDLESSDLLHIDRTYLANGQPTTSFADGDVVRVNIKASIDADAPDSSYQIIDILPAGLKPVTQIYDRNFYSEEKCDSIWYPTRVVNNKVYLTVYKGFEKTNGCAGRTIGYYARVVSPGSYRAQPAIIQSLLDEKTLAVSKGQTISIK